MRRPRERPDRTKDADQSNPTAPDSRIKSADNRTNSTAQYNQKCGAIRPIGRPVKSKGATNKIKSATQTNQKRGPIKSKEGDQSNHIRRSINSRAQTSQAKDGEPHNQLQPCLPTPPIAYKALANQTKSVDQLKYSNPSHVRTAEFSRRCSRRNPDRSSLQEGPRCPQTRRVYSRVGIFHPEKNGNKGRNGTKRARG